MDQGRLQPRVGRNRRRLESDGTGLTISSLQIVMSVVTPSNRDPPMKLPFS